MPPLSFKDFLVTDLTPGQPELISFQQARRILDENEKGDAVTEKIAARAQVKLDDAKKRFRTSRIARKTSKRDSIQKRARDKKRRSILQKEGVSILSIRKNVVRAQKLRLLNNIL